MPALTSKADYLSIIENCYEVQPDDAAWVERVVESASAVLDLGSGISFSLYEERNQRVKAVIVHGVGNMRGMRLATPIAESISGESFGPWFYPRQPVTLASPIVAKLPSALQFAFLIPPGVAILV